MINEWAVKHNLAVLLSLHAHQGSQNGFDHSAPQEIGRISSEDGEADVHTRKQCRERRHDQRDADLARASWTEHDSSGKKRTQCRDGARGHSLQWSLRLIASEVRITTQTEQVGFKCDIEAVQSEIVATGTA
ncbi:hypothetical protein P43SY_011020 [Pythium insidiosum]|uniref:Uncharacterized protein n=1 Tax=Pythium insidiosum TaxID=114742 RepID=A0AAD5L6B6_PYTIN|nr:hypothetical protein P43SY_011020 [Pythium insidiosum]